MKTLPLYRQNLKNKIITESMLGYALFSVNKRAKNCRDMKRKYRHSRDYYNNESRYRQMEQSYYQMKDIMLSIISPVCIHKEPHQCYTRINSTDDEYDTFCDKNCEYHTGSYYDDVLHEHVDFIDVPTVEYNYFLFYKIKNYSFHNPIYEEEIESYGLPVTEISSRNTYGDKIQNLASVQFCKNIVTLIKEGNYVFLKDLTNSQAG